MLGMAIVFTFIFSSCNDDDEFDPTLISVFVPDYWLSGSNDVFIVASDESGEVIAFAQLENGETTTLSSSEFKGKTFTASFIYRYRSLGEKEISGESFYGVKRGGTVRLDYEDYHDNDENHEAQFNISGFDLAANYYYMTSNGSNSYVGSGNSYIYQYFGQNSSRIFAAKYNNEGIAKYAFPSTVYDAFESYPFDLSTVTSDFSTETATFAEGLSVDVELLGVLGTGDSRQFFEEITYSGSNGNSIDIKFPGNAFDSYGSYTSIYNDHSTYVYDKDSKYNFTVAAYTYSAEGTGPSLTYSIEGSGDWAYMDVDYNNNSDNYYDMDLYLPVGTNVTVNIVKLPSEITDGYDDYAYENWEFDSEGIEIVDYEDFEGAGEFLTAISQNDFNSYDYNYTYVELYSEGGRIGKSDEKDPKHSFMSAIKKPFSSKK